MLLKYKAALVALLSLLVIYVYLVQNSEPELTDNGATTSLEVVESKLPQMRSIKTAHGWQEMAGEAVVFDFPAMVDGQLSESRKSLLDYEGNILVLNFWGSWCQPCVTEMPMLQQIANKYADNGVAVVGVAVDQLQPATDAIKQLDIRYDMLLGDGDGDVMGVISQYGNTDRHMPFTVIFERDGTLRYAYVGELTQTMMDKILNVVLQAEPKSP